MSNAETVFRDFDTDGVPSSGARKPKKREIRQLLKGYETQLDLVSLQSQIFDTRAELFAALNFAANTRAWVNADPNAAYNGVYKKSGASGSGSWTRTGDLPYSFIVASDEGEGTANAIVATTSTPVSETPLILLNVFRDNDDSPVTITFNGGSALTIKSNSGEDVEPGGLVEGMVLTGKISGSTFRLTSDETIAARLFAARDVTTAARDKAQEWAEKATDSPVETGQFSAKHHAVKAAASAAAASASRDDAAASQTAASVSATQAALNAIASGSTLYDTEANGRAASVNGQVFRVAVAPGVQAWRRDSSSTSTFLGWIGEVLFNDVSALIASTSGGMSLGQIARTRREGFSYRRVSSEADFNDAAGQGWRGFADLSAPQSVVKSGVTLSGGDQRAALQAAINQAALSDRAGTREIVVRGSGSFSLSSHLVLPNNVSFIFDKSDVRIIASAADMTMIRAWGAQPTANYNLPSDAAKGAFVLPIGASNIGLLSVGAYIRVRSNGIIDTSPNSNNLVKAQYFKVLAISGNNVVLDRPLFYDYLVTEGANWGIMTMLQNVNVYGGTFGIDGGATYARALDFRYVDGLNIEGLRGGYNRGSWDNTDATGRTNANIIGLRGCHGAIVRDVRGDQGAWYLVEVSGSSQDVVVRDVIGDTFRHTVSINWVDEGEPINVLAENVTGHRNTRAVFDTHDVGTDITGRAIRAYGSLFDGVQVRTSNVLLDDVVAQDCGLNGVLVYVTPGAEADKLTNIAMRNVRAIRNGTSGIKSLVPIEIDGFHVESNGRSYISIGGTTPFFDAGGIVACGGLWRRGNAIGNFPCAFNAHNLGGTEDRTFAPVTIRDFNAPANSNQAILLVGPTSNFTDAQSVLLQDGRAIGYTTIVQRANGANTAISNFFRTRNIKFSTDDMDGTAVLTAGTVTIINANIVGENFLADNRWKTRVLVSKIERGASSTQQGALVVAVSAGQIVVTMVRDDNTVATGDVGRIQYEIL